MKARLLTATLTALGVLSASAVTIENAEVAGDENEGASYSFIRLADKRVMLPLRTHTNSLIHNTDKTIWAVNYHATSDYDSVDLVIENGADIFVVPDLWSMLANDGIIKKIIDQQLDRAHFQVLSAEKANLRCQVIGQGGDRSFDRVFSVSITIANQRPVFEIRK